MPRRLVLALLAAASGACVHAATQEQLTSRAAFDLDCAPERVTIVEIDERTRGVEGCGKRATYVESCETGTNRYGAYRDKCTWVLNAVGGRPVADVR